MKTLKAWFKTWWWVFLLVGVGCVLLLGLIFGFFFGKKRTVKGTATEGTGWLPPVPPALQEKVDKAEEAALTARVEATVKAEAQIKQLEEVKKEPDGKVRRQRLAAMLKGL